MNPSGGDIFGCRTVKDGLPGRHTLLGISTRVSRRALEPQVIRFVVEPQAVRFRDDLVVTHIVSTPGGRSGELHLGVPNGDEDVTPIPEPFRTGRVWLGRWHEVPHLWAQVEKQLWRATRRWLWEIIPGGNLVDLFGRNLEVAGTSGSITGAHLYESRQITWLELYWDSAEERDQTSPGFRTERPKGNQPAQRWYPLLTTRSSNPVRLLVSLNGPVV